MMERYFWNRERKVKRNYEIEDSLFEMMVDAASMYDASAADILNACVKELLTSEKVNIYKSSELETYSAHTFYLLESNIIGLENLNVKYGVSIRKLVNIAIRNVFCDCN